MNPRARFPHLAMTGLVVVLNFPACSGGSSGKEFRSLIEYDVLLEAGTFMGDAVGEAAETPSTVCAFRMLLDGPHADAAFKDLLENAGLPGRLNALCGIYHTDPARFRAEVERYRRLDDEVETLFYCIRRKGKVSSLAESIADGSYPRMFEDSEGRSARRKPGDPGYGEFEGRTLSDWIRTLEEGNEEERLKAIGALGDGIGEPAALELARLLGHPGRDVRLGAAEALRRTGPWARQAVPALVQAIGDGDAEVRTAALDAIQSIGPWAGSAVPALCARLLDARGEEGGRILHALIPLGKSAWDVITVAAWHHPDEAVRERAVLYLGASLENGEE